MTGRLLVRLMLAALLFIVLAPHLGPRIIDLDAPTWDPAVETVLKHHSREFAGVDRWVYPGMEAGLMVVRLRAAGYECPSVQDPVVGGTPRTGIRNQTCTRELSFPSPRTLVVQASVDFGHGQSITGVSAYSVDTASSSIVKRWAHVLRAMHLIEPATLTVTGLAFESSAELARYVVDAINPRGWRSLCDRVQLAHKACDYQAELRREHGFPEAGRVPEISLGEMVRMMGSIGLRADPPLDFGRAHASREDAEGAWLDLQGADFTGAMRQVSVLFDVEKQSASKLVIRQGEREAVTIPAGGT